ncbi:hypothetical protein BN2476_500087 [Paraburkholderia piptadeniae]|uniref:Uncharacterized protein n=1 Tax=Paraburkholderia piptadeniae TaxID=1701573 RepID=A0A1N7SGS2_9BURK|nr:hypothetical protein BN2476_500087 [Paraburkholderia piptadeniae]
MNFVFEAGCSGFTDSSKIVDSDVSFLRQCGRAARTSAFLLVETDLEANGRVSHQLTTTVSPQAVAMRGADASPFAAPR